jgi:hexosaminidase
MIWAYMENVMTWYQPGFFKRFGNNFKNVWAASAYKGASGELATVTSIQHHYLNHITWNQQIYTQMSENNCHFRGIALTGWSRYDHFLQVCDLLPQAIPSLIYNLQTVQLGEINQDMRLNISKELGCVQLIPWTPEDVHDGYISCSFPGHEVYEAILPLQGLFRNLEENMEFAKKYMSPLSIKYNYAHKARAREVMDRLQFTYSSMLRFKKNFLNACKKFYWDETGHEWLEVYFLPEFDSLYEYMKSIRKAMKENHWQPRPLPHLLIDHPDSV